MTLYEDTSGPFIRTLLRTRVLESSRTEMLRNVRARRSRVWAAVSAALRLKGSSPCQSRRSRKRESPALLILPPPPEV